MTIPREPFDAATAPLYKGVNLVEASAGTGKTFAIAMLVLRFVTEFGIPLQNILVVTFTKAATEELKERIRARLASARELLVGGQRTEDRGQTDPALEAWHAGLAGCGISERLALQRLELSLLDMDLAPVFTIHGFCQRMLQEQALESGQLFDFELIKDPSRPRAQVTQDYWRRNIYPLSPLHCGLITSTYPNPVELYKSVQSSGKRVARIEPQTPTVVESLTLFDASLSQLSFWWQTHAAGLFNHLQNAVSEGKFTKKLVENFSEWWQQIEAFLGNTSLNLPDALDFLTAERMHEALNGHKFRACSGQSSEDKKEAFLSTLPLPGQVLTDFLLAWQGVTLAVRAGLVRELVTGLPQTLRHHNLLSFDDLISQLEQALLGPQGPGLRQTIGKRYQAALIDEFQDTDDGQYTIFSSLFAKSGNFGITTAASHYLYLIGDPKQAIYTFRGADIYSYFKARSQADIHLNLAKNFRSHPDLVKAVNQLFQLREDAFAAEELPYFEVIAAKEGDDGQLLEDGRPMPVMVYSQLEKNQDSKNGRWTSAKATKQIISHMTAEIARLLQPDKPIILRTTEGEKSILTPLTPRDIAILVRSHKQAEQLQTTLARAGIPAVMASQQSVFASNESHDLFLLMQALSSPGDITLLKTALTSSWFGMNGPELHALWQDPHQIDNWLDRSHDYHRLWQEQGFLAMMTSLLASEEILLTLAQKPLAERRISNIHHLLELTQTAETEQAMGPAKTLQWLRTMREDSHAMEDTELRLESDEEAVKIVTMHSAKGLEYPVVFCPFLWYRGNYIKQAKGIAICHDKDLELVMDLGSPLFEEHKQKALAEELAEELRLAYVALTRARCRCYLFWADVSANKYIADSMDSALAWLLRLNEDNAFASQVKILQDRATNSSVACEVIPTETGAQVILAARKEKGDALVSLVYTAANLYSDWLLHSYSSLTVTHYPEGQPVVTDTADNNDGSDQSPAERGALLPELPKGAPMGNVVHGLLEDIPFFTLAGGSGYQEELKKQCAWFGVKADPEILTTLLQKVVETPLTLTEAEETFCLADLDPAQIIKEMPFYFQLQPSSTGQINSILSGSRTVAPVSPKSLQGYLTGFVDLICCHQGRFYIMDYKSNWLGDHLTDYGAEALEIAMREHNYGLQYWLYTLVLHRYLQSAMSGYDYSAHFGGVMYLFVRGMEPTVPESGVYFDLPDQATLERLDHCLGRSSSVHGASDTGPSLACGRSCAVHGTHDTGPSMACGHSYGGTESE